VLGLTAWLAIGVLTATLFGALVNASDISARPCSPERQSRRRRELIGQAYQPAGVIVAGLGQPTTWLL
jgi:hypothetical protein